jgi:hypothetical protein
LQLCDFFQKLSASRIIIYGDLKRFTIYSSVMRNNIYIKSTENKNFGTVHSQIILTLTGVDKHYTNINIDSANVKSAGNLVYTDHSSFLSENHGSQNSNVENQFQNNQNSTDDSFFNSNKEIECQRFLSKLDEVPNSPMMPFFNDFKNIKLSKEFNPIGVAHQKILEIIQELQQPNNLLFYKTLEKYVIVVNLLRVLNINQYVGLKERLNINTNIQWSKNSDETQLSDRESNIRNVFYNAAAQSGTGPALLIIIDLLKKQDLDALQMIRIISQIPNAARAPTPQYVKEFFVSIRFHVQ